MRHSDISQQFWENMGRSSSAATVTAWRDSFGPQSPPAHVACVKMTNLILVENNTGLSLWHRMLYWCSEIDGPMKRAGQAAKSARRLDWLELSYSWTLEPIVYISEGFHWSFCIFFIVIPENRWWVQQRLMKCRRVPFPCSPSVLTYLWPR